MSKKSLQDEADQLKGVSKHLDSLADQHPIMEQEIMTHLQEYPQQRHSSGSVAGHENKTGLNAHAGFLARRGQPPEDFPQGPGS